MEMNAWASSGKMSRQLKASSQTGTRHRRQIKPVSLKAAAALDVVGAAAMDSDHRRPKVYVVDGHGDALKHWESLPDMGYRLLHIDSHADMFLDFQALNSAPSSYDEYHAELRRQVHLSNFIPMGILNGKIQQVTWLRSDFVDCRYNGPPPGEYKLSVGLPDIDALGGYGPALCFWQHGGKSFRDYSFIVDPLRGGYDILGERTEWPPREKNCWWEKMPYLLDSIGLYLLGEPMGTPYTPSCSDKESFFNLSVITDGQVSADTQASTRFFAGQLDGVPWILDVDLDFFATLAPDLAPIVRRMELPASTANDLGRWSQELSSVVQSIEEDDPTCPVFREPLLDEVMDALHQLGTSATGDGVLQVFQQMDPNFMASSEHMERIAQVLLELTVGDRRVWSLLLPEEWDAIVASPHGPHFIASHEQVITACKDLERLFRSLLQAGLQPPQAITIARSTDLYLPLDLGPFIEDKFMEVLQNLDWINPGEAPLEQPHAWPKVEG